VAGPARTPVGVGELFQRGFSDHQSGRLTAAEAAYRQVLVIQPDHVDALHLLGVIAHQEGAKDQAVRYMRRAIALHADFAEAHNNLAGALRGLGRLAEASCREALRLRPDIPGASHIASVIRKIGRRLCMPARKSSAATLRPSTSGS
jgi:Flp pilus assembly protein TadD